MKREVAVLGVIIFIVALILLYVVFAGGTVSGLVITGTNPDANFVVLILGLLGLIVGAVIALFGRAFIDC